MIFVTAGMSVPKSRMIDSMRGDVKERGEGGVARKARRPPPARAPAGLDGGEGRDRERQDVDPPPDHEDRIPVGRGPDQAGRGRGRPDAEDRPAHEIPSRRPKGERPAPDGEREANGEYR